MHHTSMSRSPVIALAILFALCLVLTARPTHAAPPPNIILINIDDLGYADLGCYGSTLHRTPRLDQLAAQGIRFTSFVDAANVCTPSRAALMTGCYPRRVSLEAGYNRGIVLFPGDRHGLNPAEITLPEILRQQGYATSCVGKWHLGDQPEFLPTRHGFDEYFGIPFSNDMGLREKPKNITTEYPPLPLLRNETVIEQEPDQRFLTTRYVSETIRFITANKDKPFFVYLAHTMPHWPHYSSEKFHGKSRNGPFGDAVEEIDFETGRLLDALTQLKLDKNTLVIFTSDNGGPINHGSHNEPFKAGKGTTYEGGHRVVFIARLPGVIPAGQTCHELAVNFDLLPTLAKLAGASAPTDRVIDGKDIWPLMTAAPSARSPHDAFFYYSRDQLSAVRAGPWKLHVSRQKMNRNPATGVITDDRLSVLELYNLADDPAESTNLAAKHPDIVARLQSLLTAQRADLGDYKKPTPNIRPCGIAQNPHPLTSR